MPRYSFSCVSEDHPASEPRNFERVIQHREGKRIDQCDCVCGRTAKRDLVADLATVNQMGSTPIQVSGLKHSLNQELSFAFGQFKRNPDGSVDKNHAPFKDTGEMSKFMAGENQLGTPVTDDSGKPVRRKDGTMVRRGAKMFKYGPNATPSRDVVRKGRPRMRSVGGISPGWGDTREAMGARGTPVERIPTLKGVPHVAMRERKAR